jgi:hypothetical protein
VDPYAAKIRDKLELIYVTVTGEKPSDGGWTPDESVCARLAEYEERKGEKSLGVFLMLSVCAHVSRTRKSHTPFYVNSHLFAESSLTYLKKHREYLARLYGEAVDPNTFSRRVYADIASAERDYLAMASYYRMNGAEPPWNIVVPTVWWVIASELLGRFDKPPTAAWDDAPVSYKDRRVRLGEARAAERKKIKGDKARREVVLRAAQAAMLECAQAWASQRKFITFYWDDFGELAHVPASPLDPSLLRVVKPLIDRDYALFDAARKILEGQGREFKGSIPAPSEPDGGRARYQSLALDPGLAKMLEATEND